MRFYTKRYFIEKKIKTKLFEILYISRSSKFNYDKEVHRFVRNSHKIKFSTLQFKN